MKEELLSVRNIIHDTVVLLCRNGVTYRGQLKLQGLLGVTLDDEEIFLVPFNEILTSVNVDESLDNPSSSDAAVCDEEISVALDNESFLNRNVEAENLCGYQSKNARKVSTNNSTQNFLSQRKIRKRTTPLGKYLGSVINAPLSGIEMMNCKAIENSHGYVNARTDGCSDLESSITSPEKTSLELQVPCIKVEQSDTNERVNMTSSDEFFVENDSLFDVSGDLKNVLNWEADHTVRKSDMNVDFPLCLKMLSAAVPPHSLEKNVQHNRLRSSQRITVFETCIYTVYHFLIYKHI